MPDPDAMPTIYVDEKPESKQAVEMLADAGIEVDIRAMPNTYRVASEPPVLFGMSNRYEGIEGVGVFVQNATLLGFQKR
jgi:hypothetical protein